MKYNIAMMYLEDDEDKDQQINEVIKLEAVSFWRKTKHWQQLEVHLYYEITWQVDLVWNEPHHFDFHF